MKFEEAYLQTENCVMSTTEVALMYQSSPEKFSQHKNSFYCPECRKAPLSFTNAATPYFKTYPKAAHLEWCSLKQAEMTPIETQSYLSKKENKDNLVRQLEGILFSMFKIKGGKTAPVTHSPKHDIEGETKSTSIAFGKKRFPRKRIDTLIGEQDIGCYKFFYGEIKLKWERVASKQFWKLIIGNSSTNKFICRVKITNSVYDYINDDYKFSGVRLCKIAFLARLKQDESGYLQSTLEWSDYLRIYFD